MQLIIANEDEYLIKSEIGYTANMKLIGIAGGSGSGKSTVAASLCKKHPDLFALVHVDDYAKKIELVPTIGDMKNWDHPDLLRFDDLYNDLVSLLNGKAISVITKSEFYNPNYDISIRNKKEQIIGAKPFIILEGFLALHDERIRNLMDLKIFLDITIEESSKRRSANKFVPSQQYFEKVLVPMHKAFVEPTKEYADVVIDVTNMDANEVYKRVESLVLAENKLQ
jgi:uridine kinase